MITRFACVNMFASHAKRVKSFCVASLLCLVGGCHSAGDTAAFDPDPSVAQIRVNGIDCPYCVYDIERRVGRVEGVRSVSFNQKTGRGRVTVVPGSEVSAAHLWQAVVDSGFTPHRVRVGGRDYEAPGK